MGLFINKRHIDINKAYVVMEEVIMKVIDDYNLSVSESIFILSKILYSYTDILRKEEEETETDDDVMMIKMNNEEEEEEEEEEKKRS